MKWSQPEYGPGRIAAAGQILAKRRMPSENLSADRALDIVANWRSSHAYPLQVLTKTLRYRALTVTANALVVQRLKRLPSIISKLQRFERMQLDTMNDLGGCRAVLPNIEHVRKLVTIYETRPCSSATFIKKYDYIEKPKSDGYRGVHLVYAYKSSRQKLAVFNRSRIEIQIRSEVQHVWSTAVEMIDIFTHQKLKSGSGDSRWERFFVLVSSWMALGENGTPVLSKALEQGTIQVEEELRSLCCELRVIDILSGLTAAVSQISEVDGTTTYILVLNSEKRLTELRGFRDDASAAEAYLRAEKEGFQNPSVQAVMVSAGSVSALRKAYPNYFLDTAGFINAMEGLMEGDTTKTASSGTLHRFLKSIKKIIASVDMGGDVNDFD